MGSSLSTSAALWVTSFEPFSFNRLNFSSRAFRLASLSGHATTTGVVSLASTLFRAAIGLAEAFTNANVIASDKAGIHELQGIGIVDTSDGRARCVLNGGLRGRHEKERAARKSQNSLGSLLPGRSRDQYG